MAKQNPFKKITPENESLPKVHKERVLQTVDAAKFLLEFVDLFTFKQAEANGVVMKTFLESSKDKEDIS